MRCQYFTGIICCLLILLFFGNSELKAEEINKRNLVDLMTKTYMRDTYMMTYLKSFSVNNKTCEVKLSWKNGNSHKFLINEVYFEDEEVNKEYFRIKCNGRKMCIEYQTGDKDNDTTNTFATLENKVSILNSFNAMKYLCNDKPVPDVLKSKLKKIKKLPRLTDEQIVLSEVGSIVTERAIKLINKGIDLTISNSSGQSLLALSILRPNLDTLKLLLKKGANPNQQDNLGDTPLHIAAMGNDQFYLNASKYLIEYGADKSIKNNDGKTPIDMARIYNSPEIIEFLTNSKGAVSAANKFNVGDIAYVCAGNIFGEKAMCKAEVLDTNGEKIKVLYLTSCTSSETKGTVTWTGSQNAGTEKEVKSGLRCN